MCRDKRIYILNDSYTKVGMPICVHTHIHTTMSTTAHICTHTHTLILSLSHTHTLSMKNWSLLNQPKYSEQKQYLQYIQKEF